MLLWVHALPKRIVVNETTKVLFNFLMKDQEFKCLEIRSNGDDDE